MCKFALFAPDTNDSEKTVHGFQIASYKYDSYRTTAGHYMPPFSSFQSIKINVYNEWKMYGLCFVMQYLVSFLALQSSCQGRESWLFYFNYLPDVLKVLVFNGSSSWCHVLVCSVLLWYFLIILTCFF